MTTPLLLILLIALLALAESPIFTVIAGLSVICFYFIDNDFWAIQTILIEMNRLAAMPVMVALPLFTLVGTLLTETRAPRRVMNLIQALAGWFPGGVAIAAICSCAVFTALTGASGVTIVALGTILHPILMKNRYNEKFSLGLITTSGSLGLLFPPSLPVILYGVVAQADISQIFRAALVPGLLLMVVISSYAAIRERLRNPNAASRKSREEIPPRSLMAAVAQSAWDLPIIVIILAGVYGGIVTIAEVSAVVLGYVVVVECFILKEIRFVRQFPALVIEAAILSGAIIVILGFSLGFTGYLIDQQIPNRVLAFLTTLSDNKFVFLAGLNLFLLAVGCIMDIFSAIVIVVPIIVPIALNYGVDPIHLCVIFLVNLEIGYATPPVGMNLFISSLRFDKPVTLLYRASVPFLLLMLAVLLLVTYVPWLSLWMKT